MPPAQSNEILDVFQDGNEPGVQDLFESYEEALLPVHEQLKRYKKRDLYASHFYRTSCKVFGPRKSIRRIHLVDGNPLESAKKNDSNVLPRVDPVILLHPKPLLSTDNNKLPDTTCEDDAARQIEYKTWLRKRRKLREDLNDLGLTTSWLQRKPDKTVVEERVLADLLHNQKSKSSVDQLTSTLSTSTCVNPPHFQHQQLEMQFIPQPVEATLHKLADYIIRNKISLNKLFSNCRNAEKIFYSQCKDGLIMLQKKIPVSSKDITELVNHFYKDSKFSDSFYIALTDLLGKLDPSVSSTSLLSGCSSSSFVNYSSLKTQALQSSLSKSTPGGLDARKARLKEYEAAVKLCEKNGVPLTKELLLKVLLHPGDKTLPEDCRDFRIRQPGTTLSQDFWKTKDKQKIRKKRKDVSKESTSDKGESTTINSEESVKQDAARSKFSSEKIDFLEHNSCENGSASEFGSSNETTSSTLNSIYSYLKKTTNCILEDKMSSSYLIKEILKLSESENHTNYQRYQISKAFTKNRRKQPSVSRSQVKRVELPLLEKKKDAELMAVKNTGDNKHMRKRSESLVITFPRLREVAPDSHQVNLSTGRAVISRKVDCWLSFEEYEKIRCGPDTVLRREHVLPNAFWPGHLLDKLRLYMSPCNTHKAPHCNAAHSKQSIFHQVKTMPHNGKRSNHGYNNNEITWPSDGSFVKYGNYDINKVHHL
ncbi:uncharacterized protein LOC143448801 isoform X1 [Clavelina lepadiformis]|uniref:uncharacterized protein LOC143448801 isoform X1 n=1 Tax=Clavelina lepadiformis TaxID=159417 RepID=UPI004041C0FE